MNPSIDLRIRSMQRALTEVLIPALDVRDALAQEQARLMLGHLHALALQHRHASRIEARESELLRTLARELSASADGGPSTRAAALTLVESLGARDDDTVAAAIDRLILASGDDGSAAFRAEASRLTLAQAKASATRQQNYFAAMGFGGDSDLLEGDA
jgi:hypothetical protein